MIKNQKGFTLIELLLYISIVSMILLTISAFLFVILQSRVKNQTIAEVEQSGIQVMNLLTQTIRNSTAVTSPTNGATGASLTLTQSVAANSPTIFDLATGVIRVKEGAGANISLTNSRVVVSNLSFQNLNHSIKFQYTVTHLNSNGRNENEFTQTFYGSANVRPN